jgi:hypothetical protein
MYINSVANSVMLYLQHYFYNIIFKIKHKLCIASGAAPPPPPHTQRKIVGAHLWERFWTTHIYFTRYGPVREEGTEHRSKLPNEEHHNLNSLQNIIRVIH